MSGRITITNQSPSIAVLDIEGTIGVPEKWQFEEADGRVSTYEGFRSAMDSLRQSSPEQIIVNIRSTGGNMNDALLILEELQTLGGKITTRGFGYVASAATIIAQAASEGCREISANSLYLIHRAVCSTEGNASEMERSKEVLSKTDERIAAIYAKRSGKPAKEFAELMKENNGNGRWLSPEEAVKYGLADRITESVRISADAVNIPAGPDFFPLPEGYSLNNNNMTVKNIMKRWNAFMEFLGLSAAESPEVTPEKTEAVADKDFLCGKPVEAPQNMEADIAADVICNLPGDSVRDYSQEMAELQNRIAVLEAQNARLAAGPTATMPKEDPSPQDTRRSPNEEAYTEDLRRFVANA